MLHTYKMYYLRRLLINKLFLTNTRNYVCLYKVEIWYTIQKNMSQYVIYQMTVLA